MKNLAIRWLAIGTALVLLGIGGSAHAVQAQPDYLHLEGRTEALVDVLANDTPDDGTEPVVSFQLPATGSGATITANPDGSNGIFKVSVTAGSSGRVKFGYTTSGSPKTHDVEVCWGSQKCEWWDSEPTPTGSACPVQGLCIRRAGTSITTLPNATLDVGRGVSGSYQDVAMELVNGTATAASVTLRPAAGTRFLQLVDGSPVPHDDVTVAGSASTPFTLRVYFMPSTVAAPTLDTLEAAVTAGTAASATYRISRVGDGDITVPGYASCGYGDTCLFHNGVKLFSTLGGSRTGAYDLCTGFAPFLSCAVKVGFPQEAPFVLVHNGVPGLDPAVNATFATELPVVVRVDQAPNSTVLLQPRTPRTIGAFVNPLASDVTSTPATPLLRNLRLAVDTRPAVNLPLSFRVDQPGARCEFCRVVVGGVSYDDGDLIDFGTSPSGTHQRVEVEIRNEAPRAASVRVDVVAGSTAADLFILEQLPGSTITIPPNGSQRFLIRPRHMPGVQTALLQLKDPVTSSVYSRFTLKATGVGNLPEHPVYGAACPASVYRYCFFVGNDPGSFFVAVSLDGDHSTVPGTSRVFDFGQGLAVNEWVSVPITVVNNAGLAGTSSGSPVQQFSSIGFSAKHGPVRVLTENRDTICESNVINGMVGSSACATTPVQASDPRTGLAGVTKFWLDYRWLPANGRLSSEAGLGQVEIAVPGNTAPGFGHRLSFTSNCMTFSTVAGCTFVNFLAPSATETSLVQTIDNPINGNRASHVVIPRAVPWLNVGMSVLTGYADTDPNVATATFPATGTKYSGVAQIPAFPYALGPYLFERDFDIRITGQGYSVAALTVSEGTTPSPNPVNPSVPYQLKHVLGIVGTPRGAAASRFQGCAANEVCVYRGTFDDAHVDRTTLPYYLGRLGDTSAAMTSLMTLQRALAPDATVHEPNPWFIANNTGQMVVLHVELEKFDKSSGIGIGSESVPVLPNGAIEEPIVSDTYFVAPKQYVPLPVWIRGQRRNTSSAIRITARDLAGNLVKNTTTAMVRNTPPATPNADCTGFCLLVNGVARAHNEDVVIDLAAGVLHQSTIKVVNGGDQNKQLTLTLLDSTGFPSTKGYVGLAGSFCAPAGSSASRCTVQLGASTPIEVVFRANGLHYPENFAVRVTLGDETRVIPLKIRINGVGAP